MSDLNSVRTALAVAFRHIDRPCTSDAERDAILLAMSENMEGYEAELAARALHHRREGARLQLQMHALLDGIGKGS